MAFGRDIEDVMKDGYYKTHRTYDIIQEIKHGDIRLRAIAYGQIHLTQEGREEIFEHLEARQPRRFPPKRGIPQELLKEFNEVFNGR